MIPAEAVEAAAEVAARREGYGWDEYREVAREILEAAAPYLMAQAWDEGREEGYEAGRDRGAEEKPNPYRPMRKFQEQADAAYREFVRKEHEEWLKRVFT